MSAAIELLAALRGAGFAYSPDQPRDEHGEWEDEGGGGGGSARPGANSPRRVESLKVGEQFGQPRGHIVDVTVNPSTSDVAKILAAGAADPLRIQKTGGSLIGVRIIATSEDFAAWDSTEAPHTAVGRALPEFKGMRPSYYILESRDHMVNPPAEGTVYKVGRFNVMLYGRHGGALGPKDVIQPGVARMLGQPINLPLAAAALLEALRFTYSADQPRDPAGRFEDEGGGGGGGATPASPPSPSKIRGPFDIGRSGDGAVGHVNPSPGDMAGMLQASRYRELRALAEGSRFAVWPAEHALHQTVQIQLDFSNRVPRYQIHGIEGPPSSGFPFKLGRFSAAIHRDNGDMLTKDDMPPAMAAAFGVAKVHAAGVLAFLEWRYSPDQARDEHGRWTDQGGSTGQLSWEAAPGRTSNHFAEFHTAPLAVRTAYQDAIRGALTDAQGNDLIAHGMGLEARGTAAGPGVFRGEVQPGAQALVAARRGPVDADTRDRMNASEAVRARLLRQDAGAWHKPVFRSDLPMKRANMVDASIGRPLTGAEAEALDKTVQAHMQSDFFAPVSTPRGFRLLNVAEYSGIPNEVFQSRAAEALKAADLPAIHARPAYADTGYIENNWGTDPHGESYVASAALRGRPDLQRAADSLYASLGPKIAAVEERFAADHGWKPDRSTRFWEAPPLARAAEGLIAALASAEFRYSPDQARDDHGRFADEGGGGSVGDVAPAGGGSPAGMPPPDDPRGLHPVEQYHQNQRLGSTIAGTRVTVIQHDFNAINPGPIHIDKVMDTVRGLPMDHLKAMGPLTVKPVQTLGPDYVGLYTPAREDGGNALAQVSEAVKTTRGLRHLFNVQEATTHELGHALSFASNHELESGMLAAITDDAMQLSLMNNGKVPGGVMYYLSNQREAFAETYAVRFTPKAGMRSTAKEFMGGMTRADAIKNFPKAQGQLTANLARAGLTT